MTVKFNSNKSVAVRIDPRYDHDALCASCLNWLVLFAMLHQLKYMGVVLDATKYFGCLSDIIDIFCRAS